MRRAEQGLAGAVRSSESKDFSVHLERDGRAGTGAAPKSESDFSRRPLSEINSEILEINTSDGEILGKKSKEKKKLDHQASQKLEVGGKLRWSVDQKRQQKKKLPLGIGEILCFLPQS